MCRLHPALFSVSFAHIPSVTMPFCLQHCCSAHVSRANDLQMPCQVCFWDEELTGCETQLDCLAWPKVCMRFRVQHAWAELERILSLSKLFSD